MILSIRGVAAALLGGAIVAGCGDAGPDESADDETGGSEAGTSPTETSQGGTTSTADSTTGEADSSSEGGSTAGESGSETGGSCAVEPERFLVFGDSILQCFGQPGEKDGDGCSPNIAHGYLDDMYAPGVTYENLAVGGAATDDVPDFQMPTATVGEPGHVLMLIGIGGNDLSPFLLASDADATAAYEAQAPMIEAAWDTMFEFIDDPANFPDGVTLIVDNQYNPFDDCTAAPYGFMSPVKTALLGEFNAALEQRMAAREATTVNDIYTAFLGHGHHRDSARCPFYMEGSEYWMLGGVDLIHPNTAGHRGIADGLEAILDELYACE